MSKKNLCCDKCGNSEKIEYLYNHDNEEWCLDCMTVAGHCIECDDYIPYWLDEENCYEENTCISCYG